MSTKKLVEYEFECWEINFPNDPDGEPTRGVSKRFARKQLRAGHIKVRYEGIVRNACDQAVYSHTYVPTDGNEDTVWVLMELDT